MSKSGLTQRDGQVGKVGTGRLGWRRGAASASVVRRPTSRQRRACVSASVATCRATRYTLRATVSTSSVLVCEVSVQSNKHLIYKALVSDDTKADHCWRSCKQTSRVVSAAMCQQVNGRRG